MARFNTTFNVSGNTQTVTLASGGKIRAKSKHYFYAVFNFGQSDPFLELDYLSATFSPVPFERSRNGAYIIPIENNNGVYECEIPWEVLTRKGKVYVGIFGGDMLVTNEAEIEVTHAAPVLGADSQPTQSWWGKFSAALATLAAAIAGKQDALTAGENITIEDNVISATGGGSSIEPYTSTPQMDGVGSAGSSDLYARGDHQHPTDTSRAEAPITLVFEYDNGFWEPQFSYAELMTAYEAWVNNGKRMVARLLGAHFSAGQYEEDGAIDLTHFDLAETHYVFSDVFSIASTDPEERGECQRWAFELHFDTEQTGVDEGIVSGGELFTFQVADADAVAAVAAIANAKYTKPAGGIPASDLASGVIPTVPSAATAAPANLAAVAAVGTSTKYAREDHKHKMPSASDVGALASNTTYVSSVNGQSGDVTLTVPSAATATPSDLGTAAVGTSVKYAREDHVHNKPSAADVGALAAPASASSGNVLTYDGSAWGAASAPTEVYWCTYGTTTNADIETAYNANKLVCVKYDGRVYVLVGRGSATSHSFSIPYYVSTPAIYSVHCSGNVWNASSKILIGAPSSPSTGDTLVYDGSAWVAQNTAPKYTTLTLAVADWQSSGNAYACSKTVTGMTATSVVWLEYSDTETEFTEAQSANTLTFTVDSLPSAAITVNVAFMEGSALS